MICPFYKGDKRDIPCTYCDGKGEMTKEKAHLYIHYSRFNKVYDNGKKT